MPVKGFVESYDVASPTLRHQAHDGVRVVTRGDGQILDVVCSPSSAYLLPDLSGFSLMKRETDIGFGHLMFSGPTVRIDEVGVFEEPSYLSKLLNPERQAALPFAAVGVLHRSPAISHGEAPPSHHAFVWEPGSGSESTSVTSNECEVEREELRADASVAQIASRLAGLSGLSDEQLARLFKVERETFLRWRTGALANPRPANRRRLGLLFRLVEDLDGRSVNIKNWMLNQVAGEGTTPYELLANGQIERVSYLAAAHGTHADRDASIVASVDREPLQFGDDDVWELPAKDDEA